MVVAFSYTALMVGRVFVGLGVGFGLAVRVMHRLGQFRSRKLELSRLAVAGSNLHF